MLSQPLGIGVRGMSTGLLAAVLITTAHADQTPKERFHLVIDGKTAATVIFPAKPTRSVQMALRDFQYLLRKIAGTKLPAYPDDREVEGPVVLIGPSPTLARRGVGIDDLAYDDCRIVSGRDFLAIVGRDSDASTRRNFYSETLMGTANGVYNYFWFPWRHVGPGPKMSMAAVASHHRLYRQQGVRVLYYCSRPTNWALEGVQYYLDHRLRMSAEVDPKEVLRDYCEKFYGPAQEEMFAFDNELERVLNIGIDFPEGRDRLREKGFLATYTERWTKENVERVMACLATAERAASGNEITAARVSLSKTAMEWVEHTANVCRAWQTWQKDSSAANKQSWQAAVNERTAFIDALIARIESGRYTKLGLPPPFAATGVHGKLRDELIRFGNRGKVFGP